tara:strand:- start:170512 stop:171789 length:1278 start_codon:yes stop_codon:yes gene_type:complete
MTEDFLHYLWRFKKINIQNLKTVSGEKLELLRFGMHNSDSGPDFSNALLRIENQLWAGNIEIHIKNSDWRKHKHQNDRAYRNVILHVVYEYDTEIKFFDDGPDIPCLEIKDRIDEQLYWQYEKLVNSEGPIVCYQYAEKVEAFIKENMLHRLVVERLEHKTRELGELLEDKRGNWNELFYEWLFRAFGLKVNAEPMRMLSRQLSSSIIYRHRNNLEDIESLLFGLAGMLNPAIDDYSKRLFGKFQHFKIKYHLSELDGKIWKFSRMRPHSFPSLRIAQLSAFLFKNGAIFHRFLEEKNMEVLQSMFKIEVSEYWQNHFRFGLKSKPRTGDLGENFRQTLLLNSLVPIQFLYSKEKGDEEIQKGAFEILEKMKFESNQISRIYEELNFPIDSAYHSQAFVHLHQFYCKPKKCLNCNLGTHLMTVPK